MTERLVRRLFMADVVSRAHQIEGDSSPVWSCVKQSCTALHLAARGIWLVQGGQSPALPEGFTREMAAEVTAADAAQDADLMSDATVTALVRIAAGGLASVAHV